MKLTDPVTSVKGVGPELAKKLATVGIRTVGELIMYLPRRYEDFSTVTTIRNAQPGAVTFRAAVRQAAGRYVRRGMHITEAVVSDDTDSVRVVWFNQPYRAQGLKQGAEYYFSGTYELSRGRMQLMNPSAELVSEFTVNTARVLPVYRETKGLTSKQIRKALSNCIAVVDTLTETLPAWMLERYGLLSRSAAMRGMHYPESAEHLAAARRRLGFEEVLELSLASLLNKQENAREPALAIPFDEQLAKAFVEHLPFALTNAQRKAVWQVYQDMQAVHPMNRLVEGDVGSGKTVVAAMAAVMVLQHGYQVALMAPTEILARQHAATLHNLLQPLGMADRLTLLVGALTTTQKQQAREAVANGQAQFVVGTHALIQDSVDMHRLGLILIDEQHRFGVEQRKTLMAKAGHMPHVLSLTATPIPRSLALTLYGELDVSVLGEKPAGRQPIQTHIVSPNSRAALYRKLADELQAGRQVFVVCPLVAESDSLQAASAEQTFEQVQKAFPKWRVGLLHGKMKAADKQSVMASFAEHRLDLLVATTVIEVGVDVPNASVMVIESADRFGLAQLHQLRGRVGRGEHTAYCYLVMSDSSAPSKRLRALESSNDGFRLAELDLELRGPGAIYGAMQHGALDLRVAKLTDVQLITDAREAAATFLKRGGDLVQYEQLYRQVNRLRAVTNLN